MWNIFRFSLLFCLNFKFKIGKSSCGFPHCTQMFNVLNMNSIDSLKAWSYSDVAQWIRRVHKFTNRKNEERFKQIDKVINADSWLREKPHIHTFTYMLTSFGFISAFAPFWQRLRVRRRKLFQKLEQILFLPHFSLVAGCQFICSFFIIRQQALVLLHRKWFFCVHHEIFIALPDNHSANHCVECSFSLCLWSCLVSIPTLDTRKSTEIQCTDERKAKITNCWSYELEWRIKFHFISIDPLRVNRNCIKIEVF